MMEKNFKSNAIWVLGGAVFKALVGFFISILTARYLGPSNFGVIGYINSIANLFTAIASLGFANILIKEYVNNKNEIGQITGTAATLQLIASVISYGLTILIVFAFNINDKIMIICALIQSAYHIFNCFDSINYFYQSEFKSKFPTIVTISVYLVIQLFKVVLLFFNKGVQWFSLAISLESLVVGLSLMFIYIIKKEPTMKFCKVVAKRLLKQSFPFIISGTIAVLYASIDKIMLKEIFNSTVEIGYYNVGYNLSHFYIFLLNAVISSFSALIFEYYKAKDFENANLRARQLYLIIFFIGCGVGLILTIICPVIIPILYSKTYLSAIIPTILLGWSIPFAYITSARNIQFTSENLQKYTILFSCCTVVINISLNAVFIPLWGATGAALGTLLSEIITCVILPIFFKKTKHIGKNIIKAFVLRDVHLKDLKNSVANIFKKKTNVQVSNNKEGESNEGKD